MPPKTKSHLMAENATLRARLAELEDKLAIRPSKSLGLTGIRERVLLPGGEVSISGKPGKGTLVKVTLPFRER